MQIKKVLKLNHFNGNGHQMRHLDLDHVVNMNLEREP